MSKSDIEIEDKLELRDRHFFGDSQTMLIGETPTMGNLEPIEETDETDN